ncbi:hypothetical protein Peur_058674 [Populus x canadensis]
MLGFYGAIVAVLFPARNQWQGCEEWPSFKLSGCKEQQGIEGIKILKAACCASRFYRPSLNIHPNEASMRFKGIHRMSAIHRVDINLASQS